MGLRKIVLIDEEKCDGCGQCVPACAEGAIQVIDGKARLVADIYCDGLGACLGECPRGAITIQEREAEAFDPEAVERHLRRLRAQEPEGQEASEATPHACPGAAARSLRAPGVASATTGTAEAPAESELANWPVQIQLVPVEAPWFDGADLLIAADCVACALPDLHRRFLAGRVLLVGCPKLDDVDLYRHKLAQIFKRNNIRSVSVLHMEVPCCFGLVRLVGDALEDAGVDIPAHVTEVGIRGDVRATEELAAKGVA
jgi:ferredoxin